ncbi:MAG: hypothetical protein DSM106950_12900 [Stigonema ocellatum SAG 48.90 = DSM 106950]|nr:hypothetical protein [Stigonema ocellatum SAG 48.90 = DSM 106950]
MTSTLLLRRWLVLWLPRSLIKLSAIQSKIDILPDIQPYLEEFWQVFTDVAGRTRTPAEVVRDRPIEPNPQTKQLNPNSSTYPAEFESLIQEKLRQFCGRKFVFAAFEKFLKENPKGYFTVVGDAGMGKSAIAAKYVFEHQAICYFNIRAEGRNRPESFLKTIRQQLIHRYQLEDAADDDLPKLLAKVSEKITATQPLVIVVDALDEVEQEGSGNLLYLPINVPNNIYFILTRRPYNQNEKRLQVSPDTPLQELDLRNYFDESSLDVKEYIRLFLNQDKHGQNRLSKWIEARDLTDEQFVQELAKKSENNFMYLKFVLPDITSGKYNDLSLDKLPVGLVGYYENHWQLMGMTTKPLPKNKIKIVYVMSTLHSAASCSLIAKYSQQSELTVQDVLEGWAQFLQKQENCQPSRYRFYHESFRDFLYRQDIVQKAGVNLPNINAEVAEIITATAGIFSDEGIFGDG